MLKAALLEERISFKEGLKVFMEFVWTTFFMSTRATVVDLYLSLPFFRVSALSFIPFGYFCENSCLA